MSAYLINPYQIGQLAIALFTVHGDIGDDGTREDVAEVLGQANLDSLQARYPASDAARDFLNMSSEHYLQRCVKTAALGTLDPRMRDMLTVLATARCYDYQACEVAQYDSTRAAVIVRRLIDGAISALPGYGAAPRELEEPAAWPVHALAQRRSAT